jgi:Ser/Thr protein kinase RdoA (MazF antagonist)
VYGKDEKFFLRITKPNYYETAMNSLDIHLYLQSKDCNVPKIIFSKDGNACVPLGDKYEKSYAVLYEFLEGEEVDPEQDAEEIGRLLGRFHNVMEEYVGELRTLGKEFFVGRYLEILRKKNYKHVEKYVTYGNELWESVKDLLRTYCHGDMYSGNIHKATDGKLYLLDFDTSCRAFSMYDLVLISNRTDYFVYKEDGYEKTKEVFYRVLSEYQKVREVSEEEISAFNKLMALYHFSLQATIVELFGLECIDETFIDGQLYWLNRWKEECIQNGTW